jgi:hypothetical protein
MSTHWGQLVAMWRDAGLQTRPGVGLDAIRAFEAKHDVVLPGDLREYFLTVDGMEDELDSGTNRFWPLSMVKLVSEELKEIHPDRWAYPECFIFADHCIWCLAWAVRIGKQPSDVSGPVFQVTGDTIPGRMIAASFTDFVEMYLRDPYSVL